MWAWRLHQPCRYAQAPSPADGETFTTFVCEVTVRVYDTQDGEIALAPGHSLTAFVALADATNAARWSCTDLAGVLTTYTTACTTNTDTRQVLVDAYYELDGRFALTCAAADSA